MVSPGDPKRPTLSWQAWTVLALGLAAQVAVTVLVLVIAVNPGRPAPPQQVQLLPYFVAPTAQITQAAKP